MSYRTENYQKIKQAYLQKQARAKEVALRRTEEVQLSYDRWFSPAPCHFLLDALCLVNISPSNCLRQARLSLHHRNNTEDFSRA